MAIHLTTRNDNILTNNLIPQNIFTNDYKNGLIIKYTCILSSSKINIIHNKINELQTIEMTDGLKKKINEYNQNMKQLLQIYDSGRNNKIFKDNNFSLYADMQHQLSIIIDIKYDIIEKLIKTPNEKQVINKLDSIITEHKNIIKDINKTILPDTNITD